jgi:hypothetical protein
MDATKLRELKLFVQQLEASPELLASPSLHFFRDYLKRSVALCGWLLIMPSGSAIVLEGERRWLCLPPVGLLRGVLLFVI